MSALFALLLSLQASADLRSPLLPPSIDRAALAELTRDAELFLLPEHGTTPFRALLVSSTKGQCTDVERAMMNVREYPKRWDNIQRGVKVLEESPKRVHYALRLDMLFSPEVEGLVENPRPGVVVYHDLETGGLFTWWLLQVGDRCLLQYDLYQPEGKNSSFVELISRLQTGVTDAAELSAALASARGFASRKQPARLSRRAKIAWQTLGEAGTAIRLVHSGRKKVKLFAHRRVQERSEVLARQLGNPNRLANAVGFYKKAVRDDKKTRWYFNYFGGRVTFVTLDQQTTRGDVVVIDHRVSGGDLHSGRWRWRLTPTNGATDVELEVDLDVIEGSRVLRALASQDQVIEDATRLQFVLEYMRVAQAHDGQTGGVGAPPRRGGL